MTQVVRPERPSHEDIAPATSVPMAKRTKVISIPPISELLMTSLPKTVERGELGHEEQQDAVYITVLA